MCWPVQTAHEEGEQQLVELELQVLAKKFQVTIKFLTLLYTPTYIFRWENIQVNLLLLLFLLFPTQL